MSTSELELRTAGTVALRYLICAACCALFGAVYEHFSHGVFSGHMVYAFVYPLLGGALPFLVLGLYGKGRLASAPVSVLYHCGIATLTAGSIIRGVLEIYGTANGLTVCYPIAGWTLVILGVGDWLIRVFTKKSLF